MASISYILESGTYNSVTIKKHMRDIYNGKTGVLTHLRTYKKQPYVQSAFHLSP